MMPFAAAAVVLALSVPHEPMTPLRVLAIRRLHGRRALERDGRSIAGPIATSTPRTRARRTGRWRPVESARARRWPSPSWRASRSAGSRGRSAAGPALLAPAVLAILLGYSYAKRLHVGGARLARPRARARAGRRLDRDGRRAEHGHRAAHGGGALVALRLRRPLRAARTSTSIARKASTRCPHASARSARC